jgi:hypothetical protein
MRNLICISILLSIAGFCSAQSRRLPASNLPCADAFANAGRASFDMAEVWPMENRKHKYFIDRGFAFGDVAQRMYGGDHSQDARLCGAANLQKLEAINVFLDKPYVPWQDHAETIDARMAEKYLKSK